MGPDSQGKPFAILFALVAASIILVIIGLVLHRRGSLASRPIALGWAILCLVPLFGAGFVLFTKHAVEQAEGVTKPGVSNGPVFQNQTTP